MLTCDGYKMFYGTVMVTPVEGEPHDETGTWLYRPDRDYWYCKPEDGKWVRGWPTDMLSDFREQCMIV